MRPAVSAFSGRRPCRRDDVLGEVQNHLRAGRVLAKDNRPRAATSRVLARTSLALGWRPTSMVPRRSRGGDVDRGIQQLTP
jgi:hypothetical protein